MSTVLTSSAKAPAISGNPAKSTVSSAGRNPIVGLYETISAHRFLFPTFVFLVHYLIVQVAATLAYIYGTAGPSSGPYESSLGAPQPMTGFWENIVSPLRLWDGLWYKQIADLGYDYGVANTAFWPILPWVMKYGSSITGLEPEVVGYLFANACFLGALIVLYQLIPIDFDRRLARTALWAMALFPTAFFFSAVYTEAPFLFFAALCLLCARKGEWLAAGVVGLIAALTRSQGVMLLAPMGILLIQQNGLHLQRWLRTAPFAALPALGPAIFAFMLSRINKPGYSYRSFIDVQGQWNRASATPWETFSCAIRGCNLAVDQYGKTNVYRAEGADWSWFRELIHNPSWSQITSGPWRVMVGNSDTLELVMTIMFLALGIVGLFKLPLWMSFYAWPPLLVPLFQPSSVHPLMSMPRFVIVLFPLFIVLAMFLEGRWTKIIATIFSVLMLIALTLQFSHWYWVS